MKHTITSLFLLLTGAWLSAQPRFIQEFRTDRNDGALAVQQVENKEYLMLNYRFGAAGPLAPGNLNLTKMSDLGRQRWSRDYDFDFPVAQADLVYWPENNAYLVSTISAVDTTRDKIVARFNTVGGLVWARRFGGDSPVQFENTGRTKVLPIADTALVVAAGAAQLISDTGDNDLMLAKLNQDGELLWSRSYCFSCLGNYNAVLGDLLQTSDGGFLLSGGLYYTGAQGIQQEALLLKTDNEGQLRWVKSFAIDTLDFQRPRLTGWSLAEPKPGQFVLTGTHDDLFGSVTDGLFLTLNDTGAVQFSTRWNVAGGDFDIASFDLVVRDTGSVVIAGSTVENTTPSIAREYNFLAAVTTDSLNVVWAKNYFEEIAVGILTPYHSLTRTEDGGYAYFITTDTAFVNANAVLVKTNDAGFVGCEQDLQLVQDSVRLLTTDWTIQVLDLNSIDTLELKDEMVFSDIRPTMEGLELTGGGGQSCEPVMELLDATVQEAENYLWNTGATTPVIEATMEGMFTVEVSSESLCFYLPDTTTIVVLPPPMGNAGLIPDTLCESRQALLVANGTPVFTFTWSTGENAQAIIVDAIGTYTVTMTNPCGTAIAEVAVPFLGCICTLEFPNAFTPNGDGTNDRFRPVSECSGISRFEFYVYNRWGEEVYRSTSQTEGWNGENNGTPAPSDVYVWYAKYISVEGREVTDKGDVSLLR